LAQSLGSKVQLSRFWRRWLLAIVISRQMALLLPLVILASVWCGSSHGPVQLVPEFDIHLDARPEDRFDEVIQHFNSSIQEFYHHYLSSDIVKAGLQRLSARRGPEVVELQGEISAFSKLTGLPRYGFHSMQMLYELNTLMVPIENFTWPWKGLACTGILAINKQNGMVYHARNLDFSPAEYMQRLVYTGIFKKSGKELFRAQMLAGYSLPATGMKMGSNGFSLELNTRFPDHKHGDEELLKNLFTEKRPLNGWVVRKVLETAADYEAAVEALSTTPYCTTEYHIIGGVRKGTILARNPDGLAYQMTLGKANYQCPEDYIIITNFDYFFHDDREWFDPTGGKGAGHPRRIAAQKILNSTKTLTPEALYATISDFEVQAKDTIFQAIMNVEIGLWNTSLPACTKCGDSKLSQTMFV